MKITWAEIFWITLKNLSRIFMFYVFITLFAVVWENFIVLDYKRSLFDWVYSWGILLFIGYVNYRLWKKPKASSPSAS